MWRFVAMGVVVGLAVVGGIWGYGALQKNPLYGVKLYDNLPTSKAKAAIESGKPSGDEAAMLQRIASPAQPLWLTTPQAELTSSVGTVLAGAKSVHKTPIFVIYGLPGRDCGQHSAGGALHAEQYRGWIDRISAALVGSKSIVIMEPDALASEDCLPGEDIAGRHELIKYAIGRLKSNPRTILYLDAGNAGWISAQDMAIRLKLAGISRADGFAVNVSNYYTTGSSVVFGQRLARLVDGKGFVVDTSRNGRGPAGGHQWCNPAGRGLGALPQVAPGPDKVDAYLWIKNPGESDGICGGGPAAGQWWPERALELARNAQTY